MSETVSLHRETSGDGDPLIILHGLYGAGHNWKRHSRWLAETWRVIAPDLRNHGRSPHAEPMTYPAMAADVAALLDEEGLESAVFLGHSMGGKVAMSLALTQPDRVRGLVVADMAPVAYHPDHHQVVDAMMRVPLDRITSRRDADAVLAEGIRTEGIRQFLLTNLERGPEGWRWRLPLETLRAALPDLRGWWEPQGEWRGPAAFIHGALSDYVTPETEPAIRRHFPDAEIHAIDNAGHFLHVEAPEAFAATLDAFLRKHFS